LYVCVGNLTSEMAESVCWGLLVNGHILSRVRCFLRPAVSL